MELSQLIQLAIELGITPLNIVLIVMLYFMGASNGIFPKFWKKENEESPTLKQIFETMTHLKNHYNDTTTENLELIGRNQDEMKEKLNKISTHQDLIKEEVKAINTRLNEYDKYGIPPIRKST